ncbi:MAG: MBL fold metallo-hydrolase [Bacillota bacterium]|nr:MBL fold metallo-hydrolase [Bacillota bacterium]MDW7684814.1 MBL fold metallo-hydrolase [Bacillota bacterium]
MKKIIITLTISLLAIIGGCRTFGETNDLQVFTLTGRYLETNTYILAHQNEAIVIDPASEEINHFLRRENLKPVTILLTHGHFDHIAELATLHVEYPGVKILIHPGDAEMLSDPEKNLSVYFNQIISADVPWEPLQDGDLLLFGTIEIEVIATPGHSPGSVCFHTGNLLFTGDTLFKGGTGRTDFPGGNAQLLAESLETLYRLPNELVIYPGHGETSTLRKEKGSLDSGLGMKGYTVPE